MVHQTGESMRDEVESTYRELGIDADVVVFIDEMARAYSNATLVLARAGATTLAELCAIGRPSVLVPFPFAADDHQAKNAMALQEQGAAVCIRESDLEPAELGDLVAALLDDPAKRRSMASGARDHGRPDAAAAIVDDILAWIGVSGGTRLASTDQETEPTEGQRYSSLSMAPSLRLGCSAVSLHARSHRPRRPVVVDGAVWE